MSSDSATTIDPTQAEDGTEREGPAFRVAAGVVAATPPAASRYERGKEIARGGLGRVTSALDRTLQREVAIKELHQRTEQGLRRFVREGLTTARLQHPAIVPILDAGTWEGGDPFLVMKLLEGKTLAEELAERTTTEARIALLPNLLAVADALGFAHEKGVVHRDVKPANIMLGTHGETVLLDWGVAHDDSASQLEAAGKGRGPEPIATAPDDDPALTVAGSVAGTVRYMSPEQARGEPPVPGFDVYSLGITLANALGGGVPFDGTSQDLILQKLRTGRAEVPGLPAGIPADLRAIVAKATAPPGERYAHAGELADDLRKYIAGQLVSARSYTRGQMLARWLRRNRVYVGVAAAALSIVAGVAIVAVRSVVRERGIAVAERAGALARAHELVLLQARASLRSDPTATIAWLKEYPAGAPHQDELLAMVDEAAGRGVARHVWRGASGPADATFTFDDRALVLANRDGTLVRAELATGARRELGAIGKPFLLARSTPDSVLALDQDGGLHRVMGDGPLERRQSVPLTGRAYDLYFVRRTNELKVVFPDDEAVFVPLSSQEPARATVVPAELEDYDFGEDEHSASAWYVVRPNGDLMLAGTGVRKLWSFAPGTWVRSSDSGEVYLAVVPGPKGRGMGDGVTLWIGKTTAPPVQVGAMRACRPADDRAEDAEISDDGRVAAIRRCGSLLVLAHGAKRASGEPAGEDAREEIARELEDAGRITMFRISPDGRALVISRPGATEVLDLASGASRQVAGVPTITANGISPRSTWVFSIGGDHETRAWSLAARPGDPAIGQLAQAVGPARLVVVDRPGELVVLRHLACSRWRVADRVIAGSIGITAIEARDLDQESLLWPLDISARGSACVFGEVKGDAIVVTEGGEHHTLVSSDELTECVLSADGARATCRDGKAEIAAFEVAGGKRIATRTIANGTLRGIAGYRGEPVALVARPAGCTLEDAAGAAIATLPGGGDCRRLRASNASHPGRESALLVVRPSAVDVWTGGAGALTVPTETGAVEVSRERGLVAVARRQDVEIWDLQTRARRPGPPPHARAIDHLAWSPRGTLASVDDEVVRLWDPATGIVRAIYAPHTISIAWSADGATLFTTDGRTLAAWPIDMARGASASEVRARLDELTSARIIDGRVATP